MWQFRKHDDSKWYWKEVDEMGRLLRMSAEYFRDRTDCLVHAMRHGYVHPRQRALVARSTTAERSSAEPRSLAREPRRR
jgi:hypothetical protein